MHNRFPHHVYRCVTLRFTSDVIGLLTLLATCLFAPFAVAPVANAQTTAQETKQSAELNSDQQSAPLVRADKDATPDVIDETTARAIKKARDAGRPVVVLQTNLGTLHLELLPEKAPKNVENFLSYVNDGFYNGTVFHRVIEGFMIQGGGLDLRLNAKGTREPVTNEADNGLFNKPFTLAMARTADPHSATSQFFINTADNDFLNHKGKTPTGWGYTVIGQLIGGMRIAEWISKAPTGPEGPFPSDVPVTPIVIKLAQQLY